MQIMADLLCDVVFHGFLSQAFTFASDDGMEIEKEERKEGGIILGVCGVHSAVGDWVYTF